MTFAPTYRTSIWKKIGTYTHIYNTYYTWFFFLNGILHMNSLIKLPNTTKATSTYYNLQLLFVHCDKKKKPRKQKICVKTSWVLSLECLYSTHLIPILIILFDHHKIRSGSHGSWAFDPNTLLFRSGPPDPFPNQSNGQGYQFSPSSYIYHTGLFPNPTA